MASTCPWCNAPRDTGDSCPKCGANYAKAELIKKQGKAAPLPPVEPAIVIQDNTAAIEEAERNEDGLLVVDDPKYEFYLCVGAIPAMLVIGLLCHFMFTFVQHTFFAMPVHEFGHAVTAWFTGHWAIPTLWITPHGATRDFVTPVILLAALGYMIFSGWKKQNKELMVFGAVLLVLQVIGTLVLKQRTAQMLIVFGGDGIGMVVATCLMAAFFFGKKTDLYRGSVRWGFVAIGAAAFIDLYEVWWASRTDYGRVPFGEFEASGNLSDATKLVDDYGWDTKVMITRYVTLGICCLVALAIVYAWGVWQAWKKTKAT